MQLDDINRKLLNLIQTEFPLNMTPFTNLGVQLDIDPAEVLQRIEQLKANGIVRQIGPVMDARSLGYQTTLVAMKVPHNLLDLAENIIYEHQGISHGYERNHHFNVWFTLAVPATTDIEMAVQQLTDPIGCEAVFTLPSKRVFKIRVYFNMERDYQVTTSNNAPPPSNATRQITELSQIDRAIINILQQDLPLTTYPFSNMATQLNIDEEKFLNHCQSLKKRGIIRRFGASINHNQAGFKGNAMTCWIAPPDIIEIAGHKLASLKEVSHCYERKTNSMWPHNLFAMIHSNTREICQEIARKISDETGLSDYVMLFSTKEFKKTRVIYTV